MPKNIKILATIVICVGISVVFTYISLAGTVGNTAAVGDPDGSGVFTLKKTRNLAVKTGGDVEFVFDRDLKMSDASGSEITSAEWYMGSISCVLFNRVEPYVKLGMAHMKVKWNEGGADVKMDSQNGFAWSLGSKVLVWNFEKPHLKLVADGFYRVADLDAEGGTCSGSSVPINKANSRFFIREWQIALIAATDIDISTSSTASDFLGVSKLVPYVGMKYSDVSGRLRMTWDSGNYNNPGQIRSRHKFGVVAGCDFIGPNSISFNLEGRFFDETAVTAGLQVLI